MTPRDFVFEFGRLFWPWMTVIPVLFAIQHRRMVRGLLGKMLSGFLWGGIVIGAGSVLQAIPVLELLFVDLICIALVDIWLILKGAT